MPRALLLLAMLLTFAGPARGVDLLTNHIGFTVNDPAGLDWKQFKGNIGAFDDTPLHFYSQQTGTSFTGWSTYFRLARVDSGTTLTYFSVTPSQITVSGTNINLVIPRTNVPPENTYLAELWATNGPNARTLARGKITVTYSLYTDATYAPVVLSSAYLPLAGGVMTGPVTNQYGFYGSGSGLTGITATAALDAGEVNTIVASNYMTGANASNVFYRASNPSNYITGAAATAAVNAAMASVPDTNVTYTGTSNRFLLVGVAGDTGLNTAPARTDLRSAGFPVLRLYRTQTNAPTSQGTCLQIFNYDTAVTGAFQAGYGVQSVWSAHYSDNTKDMMYFGARSLGGDTNWETTLKLMAQDGSYPVRLSIDGRDGKITGNGSGITNVPGFLALSGGGTVTGAVYVSTNFSRGYVGLDSWDWNGIAGETAGRITLKSFSGGATATRSIYIPISGNLRYSDGDNSGTADGDGDYTLVTRADLYRTVTNSIGNTSYGLNGLAVTNINGTNLLAHSVSSNAIDAATDAAYRSGGGGGSQTPWTNSVNAAGYGLTNLLTVGLTGISNATAYQATFIWDATNKLIRIVETP